MKRKRAPPPTNVAPSASAIVAAGGGSLQAAISKNDPKALATEILLLCGMNRTTNPPTKQFSDLLSQAAVNIADAVTEGIISKIEESERDRGQRSEYFGAAHVPVDCISLMANYLETGEKMQLAYLNKSWKLLSDMHYLWQVLDPFPIKSFSNYAALKSYTTENKQKFIGCRVLQMPKIPTSMKMFQHVFKAMPRLNSISLFNAIGSLSVKHCISSAPNPSRLIQLSVGLSTRVSPLEITSALKSVGNTMLHCCTVRLTSSFAFYIYFGKSICRHFPLASGKISEWMRDRSRCLVLVYQT